MKIQNFNLIKWRIWMIIELYIIGIYSSSSIISSTAEDDSEQRSQRGMALLNHTYKSLYTPTYPGCLMACIDDSLCKSLNYWWYSSKCDLNNRTKYSAEATVFNREISSTYMGLTRESAVNGSVYRSCRHVHPSSGDGEYSIDPTLSGSTSTVYCDMTTDGGGWTALQMVTINKSNLQLSAGIGYSFKGLSFYRDHGQKLTSSALLQLRNEMGFKQLRFYCQKKRVGTVFHVMTNFSPLGEAVVRYFTDDDLISTRPQTCGSYTVLPDDNSTLAEDCSKLGWNSTNPDGKWTSSSIDGNKRVLRPLLRQDHHRFESAPKMRDCDDWNSEESSLSPGDTWAIFVR